MARLINVHLTEEQEEIANKAAKEQNRAVIDIVESWIAIGANEEKKDQSTRQKHKDLEEYVRQQREAKKESP